MYKLQATLNANEEILRARERERELPSGSHCVYFAWRVSFLAFCVCVSVTVEFKAARFSHDGELFATIAPNSLVWVGRGGGVEFHDIQMD